MKTKRFVIPALLIFLLALLPLYILGFKAHPSVDDFYYGVETAGVWKESGSLGAVLSESFRLMKESYQSWQGNFAAIFLMRLQPGIFGEQYYFVTPCILLTAFIAAGLYFFTAALRRLLRMEKETAFLLALLISFGMIEFCYAPADAFYWFNGGIYYCFFHSLSLFLYGLMIRIGTSDKGKWGLVLPAALLAFLIGGGNFSTSLFAALLLCCGCVIVLLKKKKKLPAFLIVTAVLLASLMITVTAPGNAVRQSVSGEGPGVVRALIYSFAYGGYSLADSLSFPAAVLWLAAVPFLYRAARRTDHAFKYPLLVLLFTFGLYSAQGTALFYAQGLRMPPRMSDIIYFNAWLYMGFNLTYILGWASRKAPDSALLRFFGGLAEDGKRCVRYELVLAACLIVGCVGLCQVTENEAGGADFRLEPLSVSAAYSLATGEASTYDREMTERAAYLEAQTPGSKVKVEPLSAYPRALVHSEITEDPSNFKNEHLAMYYGLSEVTLAGSGR